MRNIPLALALLLLLGWTACAQANVARYHFKGDSDYTRAKVSHILAPSLVMTWVMGWAYWAHKGTWRRKLLFVPIIVLPTCGFAIIELGGGGTYFMVGTRPPGRALLFGDPRLLNMERESPDPQMVGYVVALVFTVCCCILGMVLSLKEKRRLAGATGVAEKVT